MKSSRPLSALLLSTCVFAFSASLLAPPAAFAVAPTMPAASSVAEGKRVLLEAVKASVQQNPALANGVGDKALLTGVWRSVKLQPAMADSIVEAAKQIRPALDVKIDRTAQLALGGAAPAPAMRAQAAPVTSVARAPAPAPASKTLPTEPSKRPGFGGPGYSAVLGLTGVVALAAGAAALGGDDDDSSGASGGGSPESFETLEYGNQYGLAAINASSAYARGGTGSGVVVAVADTGVLLTHTDLNDNISAAAYDVVADGSDVTDDNGHGTHVAGIVGAERNGGESTANMHGVAYNATLLPINIFTDDFYYNTDVITAVDYAIENNAQVYNGSYGPYYEDPLVLSQSISASDASVAAAYQDGADAGIIFVLAAGNGYGDNPTIAANPAGGGIYPYVQPANASSGVYDDGGADYDFSGLQGMLLAVVATDEDGLIAGFSNRCGVAAAWCLAAPGVSINSTANDGSYVSYSGTSMAAPHVSGAVAILTQMFPELTPEEIVSRVLETANKTGDYADTTIYGQGFLDLEQASEPLGDLSVATGASVYTGQSVALASSNMNLGPAFGDGLRAALVGQKLAVFDSQKATFLVDLGDFAQTADSRFDLSNALRRFRSRFGAQNITMPDGLSLSYTMVSLDNPSSVRQDPAANNGTGFAEVGYQQNMGNMRWSMGYNMHPAAMFGIYQSENVNSSAMLSPDAFAAPYLSFAKQGYSMGSHMALSDTFTVGFGAFKGYPLSNEQMPDEDRAESFGQMVELGYRKGPLKFFTQLGMLSEKQTFLGTRSEGAFDLDSGTQTSFAGFNSAYAVSPKWSLVGSYYRGISSPNLDGNSLFDDISDVQSESFSLGMLGRDLWREGDSFGLLGNQPLRVINGDASMSLATGRSRSGTVYAQSYDVNLAPTGRELNLEAFYQFALPDTATQLMSSMMYRNEPGHIAEAADEGVFLLQMQQPF